MSLDITPIVPPGRQVIQSYGSGGFVISDIRLDGPVLVFPDRTLTWNVSALEDLCLDDFAGITGAKLPPDILLLGSGDAGVQLPAPLAAGLRTAGVIVECMNTGAACRTFNILMGEARPAAAALFAVE